MHPNRNRQLPDKHNENIKKSKTKMKKTILALTMLMGVAASACAQAQIKFDKVTHNFGSFPETETTHKVSFAFTNVGDKPLIINQAIASCGCTIPKYTKQPIAPGEKGEILVTYNSKGTWPGHFKKSITVRSNGTVEMTRLFIEGTMTEVTAKK